jgi:hypothetical protein
MAVLDGNTVEEIVFNKIPNDSVLVRIPQPHPVAAVAGDVADKGVPLREGGFKGVVGRVRTVVEGDKVMRAFVHSQSVQKEAVAGVGETVVGDDVSAAAV